MSTNKKTHSLGLHKHRTERFIYVKVNNSKFRGQANVTVWGYWLWRYYRIYIRDESYNNDNSCASAGTLLNIESRLSGVVWTLINTAMPTEPLSHNFSTGDVGPCWELIKYVSTVAFSVESGVRRVESRFRDFTWMDHNFLVISDMKTRFEPLDYRPINNSTTTWSIIL